MTENDLPTLLLVDHNPEFAYLIERYIEATGWRIVWTQSVQGAQALLEAGLPEMILLNLLMPAESAWSFLRELKTGPQTQAIPVAAYSSLPDEACAQQEGADYYLWHPILFEDVEKILNAVLLLK